MTSKIIVGPQRKIHVLLAVAGGESYSDDSSDVAGCQPSFLVVVVAIEFPSFVLKGKYYKIVAIKLLNVLYIVEM